MRRAVHLLGRPFIEGAAGGYRMRSRKSWALLAYLLLGERPPSRAQLAGLLFDEADDPLGALRWSLSEVRRALPDDAVVGGDPVVLRLGPRTLVDVDVVTRRAWSDAIDLPGLGSALLEGLTVRGAAAFEVWLLSEQRRLAAASEEILHEAALAALSRDAYDDAIGLAVRLVAMTPLDENHQALLIRLYRLCGDDAAAERAMATCSALLLTQLGKLPGAALRAAMRETRPQPSEPADTASIEAVLESGRAAVSAGAIETGADTLRRAVRLADGAGAARLRVSARLILAEVLVHSVRGLDEEGMAVLEGAGIIALGSGDRTAGAAARCESGYVDLLRARYDRAELRLDEALDLADGEPVVTAKAMTYLGVVHSDQGRYPSARLLLEQAVVTAHEAGDVRQAANARAMLGRVDLLVGNLDGAAEHLDAALQVCRREHWLSFAPWPQALLGEVELERGDVSAAAPLLDQAFARACQLGDPCWEGLAARNLALLADRRGRTSAAFDLLEDARRRSNRFADSYVWLDAYILDSQCTLGRRHDHPRTATWVEALEQLAARTGMRELMVRALLHGAALGLPGHAASAHLLAAGVDNPRLARLVAASSASSPDDVVTVRTGGRRPDAVVPGRA